MGIYVAPGDCIEGLSVDCTVRRWEWKGQRKHPLTGLRMTMYSTDRNSKAVVIKEKGEPEDEELKARTSHFHRIKGDTLKADALRVYVKKLQKITASVKEGVTSTHGANLVHTTDHTIAEISTPLDNQRKQLGLGPQLLKD